MPAKYNLLVINPGSTSTKIAVFENDKQILCESLHHSEGELRQYNRVSDQFAMRCQVINEFLEKEKVNKKR